MDLQCKLFTLMVKDYSIRAKQDYYDDYRCDYW